MKKSIASQYLSALAMLENAIRKCPDDLWKDNTVSNPFWQVAYHVLHFTNLYLFENLKASQPWSKHKEHYENLGRKTWDGIELGAVEGYYTKAEVLEFLETLKANIPTRLEATDMEAASGFFWVEINKFELQLYNIRHIQHHTGQLISRIRAAIGENISWVKKID